MFGVGLSVAVLLDVALGGWSWVPAVMTLLGERAWWLPAWLERRLPAVDLDTETVDGADTSLLAVPP